jgi:Right handed beta helix region
VELLRLRGRVLRYAALAGLAALGLVPMATAALDAGPAPTRAADSRPPSVPQGMAFSGSTRTTVSLVWDAASDDVGVAGYRLFKNGAAVATTTKLSHTFRNLRCGTQYTFALEAFDAARNASNRAEATGHISTRACAAPPRPKSPPKPAKAPKPAEAPAGRVVANVWVDPTGGSCVRRAQAHRWRDGQACSWNQAYGKALSGDVILVRGGSYGNVSIGPDRPSVRDVTFATASGERVTVGDLENGHVAGRGGASNVRFVGPATARTFRSDGADNVLVDRWRVDCGGCTGVQTFHLENANNVTVRNSDIGNNTDNSLIWISGSNLRFENNRVHDAGLRPGSGAHTECMYAWRVTHLTLTRNHFYHCSVMDVFITGGDVAQGGVVENNVFEQPWEYTGRVSRSGFAFHFRNGGSPSPDPSNWLFRHNTFVGGLSISTGENPVGPGGLRVTGNVFLSGAPCGHGNATYSYNAFVSGGCGSNSISRPLSAYLAGFTATGDPGNYSLRPNSVLRDRGNPTNHPQRDRSGKLRTGRPDVGAYEFRR